MDKHTPGPWKVAEATDTHVYVVAPMLCDIARVSGRMPDQPHRDNGEAHANARLIAAAPRLLGALHVLLDVLENEHYKCDLDTDECYDDIAPDQHDIIREAKRVLRDVEG